MLTTGIALAYFADKVIGVERDETKLKLLCARKIPFHEPGLFELFELAKHDMTFTSKTLEAMAEAEFIMIAVGSSQKPIGQAYSTQPRKAKLRSEVLPSEANT